MAQLLFITSRARKDINLEIAFLFIQVRYPEKDEWGNLVRVLTYIRITLHLPILLRADILSVIKWWVNAPFAAHPDCKGNTGPMMSMGFGSITELLKIKK